MMNFGKKILLLGLPLTLILSNCTDLEDNVVGKPVDNTETGSCSAAKGNASEALGSAYARLNDFSDQSNAYAMEEHPSDEMMGPTRGTDWDDFGTWRKLHQHTWDSQHNQIIAAWDNLNNGVYRSLQSIYFATPAQTQIKAEATFLKAFYSFYIVDLYGQLPSTDLANTCDGAKISSRSQAVDTLVKDLNYAVANLSSGSAGKATKEAAEFLLAKVYLNKAVYKQDPQSPAGPYTFDKADMDKVIELCNAIIASGKYELTAKGKYFDNFHWENGTRSKELIFTVENNEGSPIANARNRYYMGLHYNQIPSGWNGFTTLGDFYNSFEATDERVGGTYPGVTDKIGLNVGFLVGQQYDKDGKKLKTRGGEDLIFTPDINLSAAGEEKGIRVVKYVPEPGNLDNGGHDYVFFRYADVLLMKAEALLRGGTDPNGETAASLVNTLRTTRGASTLGTVDLAAVLAERGRELYYEGWRRNDQIRFEKFLTPVDQRPAQSDAHVVVFPLPQKVVDTNPTWSQNFGY
ncbi:RagB/SusD family nutrient uptake outer membrane protein [Xanthocytophaga agilis]|uniref:RagB/SusD family nutrient uptake outer membrane protein n=1 Tax=Xanthocytophaga agilis TaxID=3048010 RepID=A0AAE3R8R6_9BACT|nr:RagB/SusD family nutrient uptake outer membrane protein [Xanthocytophaga agilis]MDJ1503479.1 RagB/SusD family nutrient uptake outer membrane protein [Xanthocytophaga agilis]